MEEKVYFDNGMTKITSLRVVNGSNTIPISNIAGTYISVDRDGKKWGWGFVAFSLVIASVSSHPFEAPQYIGIAVIAALIMILIPTKYELNIQMTGIGSLTLTDKKRARIEEIHTAVNEAIVARG